LPDRFTCEHPERMQFERNVATRLPADLADRLEQEARDNLESLSCRLRKVVAEHFRERSEERAA
jgi:hypothetical protein